MKVHLGLLWLALLVSLACSDGKDSLTCGEGTQEVDGACVVSDTGTSMGGASSDNGSVSSTTDGGGSTSGGGNGAGSGPVPLEDYPRALASAMCEALAGCCEQGFAVSTDRAACVEDYESVLSDRILSGSNAAADPNNYDYDAELAGACARAAAEAYGNSACDFTGASLALDFDDICKGVFTGKLQPGEQCAASIECAATSDGAGRCGSLQADASPVCYVARRAQLGDDCNVECTQQGTSAYCQAVAPLSTTQGYCYTNDGLYCPSGVGTCEPLSNLGDPCQRDVQCAEGYCTNAECTAAASENAECQRQESCGDGLYCNSSNDSCRPVLQVGTSCTYGFECESGLCLDSVCVARGSGSAVDGLATLCADYSAPE